MSDAPKTIAKMREEAAKMAELGWVTANYDVVGVADADVAMRLCEHIAGAIRVIPLPADDAEIVERVARAICGAVQSEPGLCGGDADPADMDTDLTPPQSCVACRNVARAALSAMRGAP